MSDEFDIMFESPSPCCSEALDWEWDDSELSFQAECNCMKRYTLRPTLAEIEHESEEFETDDD
ncbi:hypothetical protein AMJ86_04770 [bacterium SM23_57]|nr:MAG: hypothetical protein AMJ86_04770 [bacterium SM23_57]